MTRFQLSLSVNGGADCGAVRCGRSPETTKQNSYELARVLDYTQILRHGRGSRKRDVVPPCCATRAPVVW